jgi:hypothetical protein
MRLSDLARDYEERHFPPTRRLDLQGEGPESARRRALHWIQSFAHESPGVDLLLVVERGRALRGRKRPLREAVERLLEELRGGLIDGWGPFAEGSLSVRVARDPRRFPDAPEPVADPGDGRSDATAGRAHLPPEEDIPSELLPMARRAAELRRAREGQSVGAMEAMLREVWLEAQAAAMERGSGWEEELGALVELEARRLRDSLDAE